MEPNGNFEVDITVKGHLAERLVQVASDEGCSIEALLAVHLDRVQRYADLAKVARRSDVEAVDVRLTGDVRPGDLVTSVDQETLLVLDVHGEDAVTAREWTVVNGSYRSNDYDPQRMNRHQLRRAQPPLAG